MFVRLAAKESEGQPRRGVAAHVLIPVQYTPESGHSA